MRRISLVFVGLVLSATAASFSVEHAVFSAGGGSGAAGSLDLFSVVGEPVVSDQAWSGGNLAGRSGILSQWTAWYNRSPEAGTDSVERRTGQGVHFLLSSLLSNDSDQDGDSLIILGVEDVSREGGGIYRDGPWVVYVPPAGQGDLAEDEFQYLLYDGVGAPVSGRVRVRVETAPPASAGPLSIRNLGGNPPRLEVRFQGIAGRSYRLQSATSLGGPWLNSELLTADAAGVLLFQRLLEDGPHFYRMVEP